MSFSGSFGCGWSFGVTLSRRGMAAKCATWLSMIEELPLMHERFMTVQIEHKDFRELIPFYDTEETLFYCLPADERVWCNNGFVSICNLRPNDELPNSNKVVSIFSRQASEEIVEFTVMGLGRNFPVRCSLDHKVLVYRQGNYEFVQAQELNIGDYVVLDTDRTVRKNLPKFQNIKIKNGKRKESYFDEDYFADFCRFVGYYLAEGHKSENNGLCFSFGRHEDFYISDVVNIAKKIFGVEAKVYEGSPHETVTTVYVGGHDIVDFFNKIVIGRNAYEKKLADCMMLLSPDVQIEILRGWLRGDGGLFVDQHIQPEAKFRCSGQRNRWKYVGTTVSECLMWQMYHIALRCYLHPCIKKRGNNFDVYFTTRDDIERLLQIKISGRTCKRRRWTERGLLSPVTSIKIVHYEGGMIDISTTKGEFTHWLGIVMHNCDPPYVHATRVAGEYDYEIDDRDHEDLIEMLLNIKGKAMLSGYINDIYIKLEEAGWARYDFDTVCHAAGRTRLTGILGEGAARERCKRVESVWLSPSCFGGSGRGLLV
jgi:hypothetical protein